MLAAEDTDFNDALTELGALSLASESTVRNGSNCDTDEIESISSISSDKMGKGTGNEASDDVIYIGSSITVKKEGEKRDTVKSDRGGWLLSLPKRGVKASLKSPFKDEKVIDLDSYHGSLSTTVRSNSSSRNDDVSYDRTYNRNKSREGHKYSITDFKNDVFNKTRSFSPDTFNGWLRAIINIAVTAIILYIAIIFVLAVKRDISNNIQKRRQMIKDEALACQEQYTKNQCRTLQVPALEEQCREWERCMYKDALLYEDATSLSAEVIGGVINKFISQLDIRTVIIVLAAFIALLIGCNCALTIGNNKYSWYRNLFYRNGPPDFHNLSYPQPFIQNPYIVPNYSDINGYPFVNYNNRPRYDYENYGKAKKLNSVWRRRFISPWKDEE